MAQKPPTALKIEKRKQVEARTGLSRSSIYQKVAEGHLSKTHSLISAISRLAIA